MVGGHYGISGLCLGLPCVLGRDGVQNVLNIPLSEDETRQLQSSAQKMRALLDEIGM